MRDVIGSLDLRKQDAFHTTCVLLSRLMYVFQRAIVLTI